MKFINVAYDYEYDDNDNLIDMGTVDVVLVPDFVYNNLDIIVQNFFDWTDNVVRNAKCNEYSKYWATLDNGKIVMTVGTEHFVKWLNDNYFNCEHQKSIIIATETEYNPSLSYCKVLKCFDKELPVKAVPY